MMYAQIKTVAWPWTANGVVSTLLAVGGLTVINWPGIILYILAGYGQHDHRSWTRILTIVLALLNLNVYPVGTAIGKYSLIALFDHEGVASFSNTAGDTELEARA